MPILTPSPFSLGVSFSDNYAIPTNSASLFIMTRLLLLISFTILATHTFGQTVSERNFYTYLQTKIKEASAKKDTIVIIEETKACFGSTWKAVLKPEGDFTNVVFYIDKANESIEDTTMELFQTVVDTTFSLPTKTLVNNLASEIKYLQDNLVITYSTTEYLIRQKGKEKKFKLDKGQGLYYWLRFNKSWTAYLSER